MDMESLDKSGNCDADQVANCQSLRSSIGLAKVNSTEHSSHLSSMKSSGLLSTIKYYLDDFWVDNGDPFTKEFFGMDTPWFFMSLGLSLVLFCKVIGPMIMKNRKSYDLRPLMIVLNGFAFGTYTGGAVIALGGTGFEGCFDCQSYQPVTDDLAKVSLKYIGYVLVWTKIYDFIKPVLSVLSKKQHQVTWLQMIHLHSALMFCWAGMKLNPGGIFIPIAVVDTIYQSMCYGYLVMTASSPEMRPKSKDWLLWVRVVSVSLALIHQCFFLFKENCYTRELRYFSVFYTSMLILLYPVDHFSRKRRCHLDSNQNVTCDKVK